jgi:hypothetical protein
LAIAVAAVGYSQLATNGLAPSLIVALVVAEMVCRMIVQRLARTKDSFVGWIHGVPLIPLGASVFGLGSSAVDAWIGVVAALLLYEYTFLDGVKRLRAL